jgi:hypothetical protein
MAQLLTPELTLDKGCLFCHFSIPLPSAVPGLRK